MPSLELVVSATDASPGRRVAEPRSVRLLAHDMPRAAVGGRRQARSRGTGYDGDMAMYGRIGGARRWDLRKVRRSGAEVRGQGFARGPFKVHQTVLDHLFAVIKPPRLIILTIIYRVCLGLSLLSNSL
jgi:hypothetical protein